MNSTNKSKGKAKTLASPVKTTFKKTKKVATILSPKPTNPSEFRWYTIKVYAGAENKAIKAIQEQIPAKYTEHVKQIIAPGRQITQLKNGQKVTTEEKICPNYIFMEMIFSEGLWKVITDINTFLASRIILSTEPWVVSETEIKQLQGQITGPKEIHSFHIGDNVLIREGAFKSFTGVVRSIDNAHEKLTVHVSIFGRETPVELHFVQVEKK